MPLPKKKSIAESFELLASRMHDPEFLAGHGLGNEVPFFVLPYDAAEEDELRAQLAKLMAASAAEAEKGGARVTHFDLWETLLAICAKKRITPEKMQALEERRGSEALLQRMQKIATPEAFVAQMREDFEAKNGELTAGKDVIILSGVGKVYPFVRANSILENAQPVFIDIPVVLLYPGVYDGQSLRLFGSIFDDNYYRAFNLI